MNKVTALAVKVDGGNIIYPVIVSDQNEVVLIDCGYPGCLPLVKAAATEKGVSIANLTKIIITHHDFDHMGALAAFKREYPALRVLASADDAQYISGQKRSLRLLQAEALYDKLPDSQKENAKQFQQMVEAVEPVPVDICLRDKDSFSWCGGVEIISTPGHMPGHISPYLRESKTLIAGDALVVDKGRLSIANPQYTIDIVEARRSIKKLLNYEIKKIICFHGGVYQGNIQGALEKIARSPRT